MTAFVTWVIDVHVDSVERAVKLTATDLSARVVHHEPLELLTVVSVRDAIGRLIARHGAPDVVMSDHGVVFSGLGEAFGIEQVFPSRAGNTAWMRRLAERAAR